jgi:hypothetical protein
MNRRHLLQGLSLSLLSGKLLHATPLYGQLSADTQSSANASDRMAAPERTFIFGNSSRDLGEFKAFAQVASRLKPYGDVQIQIGELADKSWYEMPSAKSPWHELHVKVLSSSQDRPVHPGRLGCEKS